MNQLVIADKHTIGDLMAHKGIWTAGTSAVNNAYKILNTLVDGGQLEKGDGGYYRKIGCRSTYQEHARELTKALAEIIKLNLNAKIFREHTTPVALRPDALILLTKEDKGLCLVLEVMRTETTDCNFYQQKVNTWESWEGAKDYLSKMFNTEIKEFNIITDLEEIKLW